MALRMHLLVSGKEFVGATDLVEGFMSQYLSDDLDTWPDVQALSSPGMGMASYWITFSTDTGKHTIRRQAVDAFWVEEG